MRSDSNSTDTSTCANLVETLAANEVDLLADPARSHIAQCLRCQAEMANYRRLRRAMLALADAPVPLDPTLEREILLMIDEHGERFSRRVPGYAAATLGGLAAAAGVIALATRQRRSTRLAG